MTARMKNKRTTAAGLIVVLGLIISVPVDAGADKVHDRADYLIGTAAPAAENGGLIVCQSPHGPAGDHGIGGVCYLGDTSWADGEGILVKVHSQSNRGGMSDPMRTLPTGSSFQVKCFGLYKNEISEGWMRPDYVEANGGSWSGGAVIQVPGCAYIHVAIDAGTPGGPSVLSPGHDHDGYVKACKAYFDSSWTSNDYGSPWRCG